MSTGKFPILNPEYSLFIANVKEIDKREQDDYTYKIL